MNLDRMITLEKVLDTLLTTLNIDATVSICSEYDLLNIEINWIKEPTDKQSELVDNLVDVVKDLYKN